MSELCCRICFTTYKDVVPPRIMSCGHSCCSNCLTQILSTSKHCHLCRKALKDSDVSQYPINYSLLEVGQELLNSPYSFDNFRKRLEKVNETHEQILAKMEKINGKHQRVLAKMEVFKNNESKLLEMMVLDYGSLNLDEANATLNTIELLMKDVIIGEESTRPKSTVDFQRSKYDSSIEFLSNLRKQILKGEKYVAISENEKDVQYADITVRKNSLMIHSFHPIGYEENGRNKTVNFEDIKKGFEETGRFKVFFKLKVSGCTFHHKVFMKLLDTPFREYFLQMCSGEGGKSFKGMKVNGFGNCNPFCDYYGNVMFHIDHHDAGIKPILNYYSGMGKLPMWPCDVDCGSVLLREDGFYFVKLNQKRSFTSKIGKVVHEETEFTFVDSSSVPEECVGTDNIIADCGMYITIDK